MIYTDTRDSKVKVDFKTAVMKGMNQATGGLYIPTSYPRLDDSLLNKDPAPSFRDIALNMAKPYVEGEIPDEDLAAIIQDAYPFHQRLPHSTLLLIFLNCSTAQPVHLKILVHALWPEQCLISIETKKLHYIF